MSSDPPTYLTPKLVAEELGISTETVCAWCRKDPVTGLPKLTHTRIGRVIRIAREDLAAFLQARCQSATPRPEAAQAGQ